MEGVALIVSNGIEPGTEAGITLETAQITKNTDLRLLHSLLSVSPVSQAQPATTQQPLAMASQELNKRLPTTLFMALEDEFGQSIPEQEVRHINTVEELIEFVEERVRALRGD